MFSVGFSEILLIVVLLILFVKPEKLPGIAKEAGRFFGELKRIGSDFKKSVSEEAAAIARAGEKEAEKPAEKAAEKSTENSNDKPSDTDNKDGGAK